MSSIIQELPVDVVCLGLGHMSGPIAAELTRAGRKVVGLEKGPFWDFNVDWNSTNIHDEWAIAVERKFDHPLYISTFTIRNKSTQFALPVRRYTKQIQYHALGHGVGGVGVHYGGGLGRFSPWSYQPRSLTEKTYGTAGLAAMLPSDNDLEDWPVDYDHMVNYYEDWENAIGVSGTDQEPFIPFHDFKFPTGPHPVTPYAQAFNTAATALGYRPYPHPTGLISETYTNQYDIARNACIHCGWCGGNCNYPCEVGAKTSSHVSTIPAALKTGNFDMRLGTYVFRINYTKQGDGSKLATGVMYYDQQGNIHFQPATVVFNGLWGYNIVRLLLLSGIGNPYTPDPTPTGSVGRGLSEGYYPSVTSVSGTIDIGSNDYCAGNAAGGGYSMMDLGEANTGQASSPAYTHPPVGSDNSNPANFIGGFGGNGIGDYRGSGPGTITTHLPGKKNFGAAWKAGLKDEKLPTKISFGFAGSGPTIPLTGHYIDLDPHYNDIYGDPLARITLDWDANTWRVATFLAPKFEEILTKMGATNIKTNPVAELTQHVDWWGHHMRGGARTGSDPNTSVFNKWMQCWDCENVFSSGEICFTFGDNITNGTHPAGAMAYLAADGIQKYLQSAGSLISVPIPPRT